ncbi:MAG: acyl carrier protein [Flavobacteriaceae bacterium]|nr:acyl carrier protein [Flavobacteriaceae bacterium]
MILERQGKFTDQVEIQASLQSIGFRSLDFSELCIRMEEDTGRELNFEAVQIRKIETVSDVCKFIDLALKE